MARRRMPTPLVLATLAAMALGAAVAPAGAQPATLRLGLDSDADALDPTVARTYIGRIVFASLCDKLVDIDPNLNIVPQLAEQFSWVDSKTLAFRLRAGLTFHDGTPVDSEAVRYSLMRHLTMQGSTRRAEIAMLDTVEIVDALNFKLHLKAPSAPFLAQLTDRAGMIISPKAAEAAGKDFPLNPVCAGPFKFTERVAQDRIVLDRFPGYWNTGAIYLDRIIFRPIVDGTVRLANLQAGSLEMMQGIAPTDVAKVQADPRLRAVISDGLGYQGLTFNIANGTRPRTPMMTDARVRQAFALSIDTQAMINVVYAGLFTPIAQAVTPASPYYANDIKPRPRDIARARALLAEAGVRTPLQVELLVTTAPEARQTGEVIQSMAAEAGFDVKIRSTETVTALKNSDDGDYEVFFIGWSGRADPDGNLYSFIHSNGGPLNASRFRNAEADSLLDQARAVTDPSQRKQLYGKLAERLNQEMPVMYLYAWKNLFGLNAKVSGFVPVPDGLIRVQGMKIAR